MPAISVTLTDSEIAEAIRQWVEGNGLETTDRFSVRISQHQGDRPGDVGYTEAVVTGLLLRSEGGSHE